MTQQTPSPGSTSGYASDESSRMSSSHNGTGGSQQRGGSALKREFSNFIADVEDLLKTTTHLGSSDFDSVKRELTERVRSARESLDSVSSSMMNTARQGMDATNRYVRSEPWKALGFALFGGFVLGLMFSVRRTTHAHG